MSDGGRKNGAGAVDRLLGRWMEAVTHRARLVLFIVSVLVVLAGLAASRLGVDPDSSKMLSPDLPAQRQALALNEAFPQLKRSLLVVVDAPSADQADMAASAIVEALENRPEWIESTFSSATDPFFMRHGFLYRDTDAVEAMFTRISKSANLVATLREEQTLAGFAAALNAAAELADGAGLEPESLNLLYVEATAVLQAQAIGQARPFGWSSVLDDAAPAGPVTRLISVVPRLDPERLSPAKPALTEIDAVIDALPATLSQDIKVAITGEPALRAEELQSVLGTIGLSLALSLVLVAGILRIGLASTGRAALAFGSLLVSLVLTTGAAALMVGQLNLVSVAFIVLMVGLGIDFAIHLLAHIAEVRATGATPASSVVMTGRRSGLALVLSAVTTALAFLAFVTTEFVGMAQLGLIGGVGVLVAFAVSVTLIPALVALKPSLAGHATRSEPQVPPARRDGTVPAVALLVVAALAVLPALQARFDADPMGLRDPEAPSVQAFRTLAADPATTPYRASVVLPDLEEAAEVADKLALAAGVGGTIFLQSLVPGEQDDKLLFLDIGAPSIEHALRGTPTELVEGTDPAPVATLVARLTSSNGVGGELGEALQQYQGTQTATTDAALNEALFRTFPLMLARLEALLDADYVTEASLPAVMRDRYVNAYRLYRIDVIPDRALTTTEDIAGFAQSVAEVEPRASGGPVQLAAAGNSVGNAMLQATGLAALATIILALVATRRVVDTAAIVVPLVVAATLTAAASTLLDMPFNYANVIVLPLLIGIGVDSGIHIALRERRAPGAVFATSTPRAVFFSALTTMAAFGTLALSDHRGTASMGALLAISMTAAVGSVLTLTPTLIRWSRRDAQQR